VKARSIPFRRGSLIFSNMFGDDFKRGIVLEVIELPNDSLEYCRCKVIFSGGKVRLVGGSYLLTVSDMEEHLETR